MPSVGAIDLWAAARMTPACVPLSVAVGLRVIPIRCRPDDVYPNGPAAGANRLS